MADPDDGEDAPDVKFYYAELIRNLHDNPDWKSLLKTLAQFKSVELQIPFIVEMLRMIKASLHVKAENVKNNKRAREYRDHGNDLFSSSGNPDKVAEMYTKSIAYALPKSRELALAYANRSAVSFRAGKYEDCLVDITRSLENDYPHDMQAKLYARKLRCLVVLKAPLTEIEQALQDTKRLLLKMDLKASGRALVEKILIDKDHMTPTLSSAPKEHYRLKPTIHDDSCEVLGATGIRVQYSEKYGRHLIATRDFRPGDIIAVIDTYANARNPDKCYRECSHCTNATSIGIPCDHCVNAIYCSTFCRDKAWKEYHEIECPILDILLYLEIPTSVFLGVRVTLKAIQEAGNVAKLKKMVEKIDSVSDSRVRGFTGNILDCSKYACLYTTVRHMENRMIDEIYDLGMISVLSVYYLATRTKVFGQKYNGGIEVFDKDPLLSYLGKLMMENFQIVYTIAVGVDGDDGWHDDLMVASFTALCNHSCSANVTSLGSNRSISFALQPIKAGDQIWDNYMGLHYTRVPKIQRQQQLQRAYHFSCDCVACTEDWPLMEQLPNATEIPGMSPDTKLMILQASTAFFAKTTETLKSRKYLDAKEVLVELLEILFEYAFPSREITLRQKALMTMYGLGLDHL